jgi:hypothetical protein
VFYSANIGMCLDLRFELTNVSRTLRGRRVTSDESDTEFALIETRAHSGVNTPDLAKYCQALVLTIAHRGVAQLQGSYECCQHPD